MSALDWAAKKLEDHGEELAELVLKAARGGDWRAAAFLYERVYGKPLERVEQVPGDVLDPSRLSQAQRADLRRRLVAEHPELLELVPPAERGTPGTPGTGGTPSSVVGGG